MYDIMMGLVLIAIMTATGCSAVQDIKDFDIGQIIDMVTQDNSNDLTRTVVTQDINVDE